MTSDYHQNCSRNIIKREVRKESKTYMESATFEESMKVVAIAIKINLTWEKKSHFYTKSFLKNSESSSGDI